MKKIFPLFLLVFAACQVHAQKNFRPGYIIQNSDTVKGYINLRNQKANSFSCQFRAQPKTDIQNFRASEISGYGFTEGIHFRSVQIAETSQALPQKKQGVKPYFLNLLVSGKADLYSVRDMAGKNRFFLQKDTVFKELESAEVRVVNAKNGQVYKGQSKTYVGTMSYLLNDCRTIQPTLNKTKLAPPSLTSALRLYNTCIHPDSLYYFREPKKSITTFGLTAGYIYTAVTLHPRGAREKAITINDNSGYFGGLTMNNTLPFLNEKLSFQTELLFVQNNIKLTSDFARLLPDGQGSTYLVLYHLEGSVTRYAVKIPIQLRYTFNFQKFQPYLSGGLILTKNTTATDQGTLSAENSQGRESITYQGFWPRPLYGNFTGTTGLLYTLKKDLAVFIELKYAPEGIRSLYDFRSDVNSWMLSTGFRL